jgi:2-polyprenyl-6-hydroxyphenyl methylase/3-demethylubiquinone-9 3-methyltransferase
MASDLKPICAKQARCKCCGGHAIPYGVVDFHKNCETRRQMKIEISGIPIYYHRCVRCGFLFTTAFDHFTAQDFQSHIYNDEYAMIDPDYKETRPRLNAGLLSNLFQLAKPKRILDYGGGEGTLAEMLQTVGFPPVVTYDPFVPKHSAKPSGKFDCVLCFEVVEHATDPAGLFSDIADVLDQPGIIFFSTLVQPEDIERQGLAWWYAAPRNAHISLHTKPSLAQLGHKLGFQLGSFSESYHVFFREEVPNFAQHFIKAA